MTTHIQNQKFSTFPTAARTLPGAGESLFRRAQMAFAAWREKRRTISELASLSDRDLADIGLTRLDVHRVFDEGFVPRR